MWMIAFIVTGIIGLVCLNRFLRSLKVGDFGDKHVFITGCDSGFGKHLAIRLNNLGFHVIAGCLTDAGADGLKASCPERLATVGLDVTSTDSIQKAFQFVKAVLPQGKGLWTLVNNAGIGGNPSYIEMCTKRDFLTALEVNLLGPIEVTATFLPLVRRARGRVVCITSVMGRYPAATAPYCVSKFGFEAYCDVLRREMQSHGVTVSILEPGLFKTPIVNTDLAEKQIVTSYDSASDDVKDAYGSEYVKLRLQAVTELSTRGSPDIDDVISAYVHALTAKYPKTRYVIGNDAKFLFVPLSFLPTCVSDWLLHKFMRFNKKKIEIN